MASMRDIKRRKDSIQSTGQITKAMKLVSTVKLQKAKGRAENTKPYFDLMYETVQSILAKSGHINHKYLKESESDKKAVIVVTANRGLAGGYNSNITRMIIDEGFTKENTVVYAVGKKGRELLERKGYEIKADYSEAINDPIYKDAKEICDDVLSAFADGEVGEIYLAYTVFKNTVVHEPQLIRLLPVEADDAAHETDVSEALMTYEPSEEEALDMIIPKYVCSLVYGALIESVASENGARMQAMDSATSNAEEMISTLSLKYNRARQASITQELTEIIAGANAIE